MLSILCALMFAAIVPAVSSPLFGAIPEAEKQELSYDKLESCMSEDMSYMRQVVAEAMLFNWRPTNFIKASKTKSADYLVYGTGVRTGVQVADFAKAKTIFNKQNVPVEGRYVILPEEMYEQLCADVRNSTSDNLSAVSGKDYFRWTSTDLTYSVEDFQAIESASKAPANTACLYGMFCQETMVTRAVRRRCSSTTVILPITVTSTASCSVSVDVRVEPTELECWV